MITLACAFGFALIHLFIGKLHILDVVPRSRWLSGAGGVAVAYIFLHVLPELSAHQQTFAAQLDLKPEAAEKLVYLVSLAGLVAFYGLERLASSSLPREWAGAGRDEENGAVFWLHVGSFALYNVLIGYLLLHREVEGSVSITLYFVGIGLHFVTSDFGLRQHHKQRYDLLARWILAAAVLTGWVLGTAVTVSEVAVGFLFALLAGGVILNVLKEELPKERRSRFWPFLFSAAIAAAVLIAI
jgi:hypothetical protein